MIKVNVAIDENHFITGIITENFNEAELYVEVEDINDITIGETRVIHFNRIQNLKVPKEVYLKGKTLPALRKEKQQHLDWLADNDYRVNKYILGEYQDNDPAWVQYKADRATKIARINEIEGLLAE